MANAVEPMCRLDNVNIVSSLAKIFSILYKSLSEDQQETIRKNILRELERDQCYLIVLLESSGVKVMSEYNAYINKSGEQQYIKQFLNKKLPVILAISIFDKDDLRGDISIVGYSKLLDRVSNSGMLTTKNSARLSKYITVRRRALRKAYKAVSMSEFLAVLRSEYMRGIEPL